MTRTAKQRLARSINRVVPAIAAALLAICVATPALARVEQQGDTPEERAGDLWIAQLWTTDGEGLRASLKASTPPKLANTTAVRRNQPIQQVILYADCQRDPEDYCWLSAKIDITAPDGKPYGEPLAFDALPLGPAAPRGAVGLATKSITFVIEDGEQLGRYRVELAITDEIAVQTAVSVVHLDVVDVAEAIAPSK